MRLNLTRPLIVFDLETTGLDTVRDRIIQLAYIKLWPDGREERKNLLINPCKPIPQEVTALTGIRDSDVAAAPTFADVAQELRSEFEGCDLAGYNSNHFDVPMLSEEFFRADVYVDFSKSRLIDAQSIFHKMEKRNLSAAYKFYCGGVMEEDFTPHRADGDVEATYRVLLGELEMYSPENQEDADRCLENDMDKLAEFSRMNDNVDFAGRFIWKPMLDANGNPKKDAKGKEIRQEVFNFGKHKGRSVADVLTHEPNFYNWMMNSDFSQDTKQVLTRIYMRTKNWK